MGNRRQARECALQLLYQQEMTGEKVPPQESFWRDVEADDEVQSFATLLVAGVRGHLAELDALIGKHSAHWRLTRMAAVDKNILRIAAFELSLCPDIPVKVAINEAVEVAKRFGTEESGAFVNGILDALARAVRPAA